MIKLVTAEEIAEIDNQAISVYGITGENLMGFAGKAVFDRLLKFMPRLPVILAGKGNNGGDGLVIAHFLSNAGIAHELILFWNDNEFSETSKYYWNILKKQDIPYTVLDKNRKLKDTLDKLSAKSEEPLLLIDAIFGTGLSKPLGGRFAEAAGAWNSYNKRGTVKIAIDIPSGINGSGVNLGDIYFESRYTYTMGLPKIGLFTLPGKRAAGEVEVLDIGFPVKLLTDKKIEGHILNDDDYFKDSPFLARPIRDDDHKYHRGVAIVIGGSPGMEGAPMLAAQAAFLFGAGIVKIFTKKETARSLAGLDPHIQVEGFTETALIEELKSIVSKKKKGAIAIGCGLGRDESAKKLLKLFLDLTGRIDFKDEYTVILDADALFLLPEIIPPDKYKSFFKNNKNVAATPHLGELTKMFQDGNSTQKEALKLLATNKKEAVRILSQSSGITILAKGSDTIIADPEGEFFVNPSGNSSLAKGGTGDILSGITLGLTAGGRGPLEALASGAYLMGRAGDEINKKSGSYTCTPGKILIEMEKLLSGYGKRPKAPRASKKWEM